MVQWQNEIFSTPTVLPAGVPAAVAAGGWGRPGKAEGLWCGSACRCAGAPSAARTRRAGSQGGSGRAANCGAQLRHPCESALPSPSTRTTPLASGSTARWPRHGRGCHANLGSTPGSRARCRGASRASGAADRPRARWDTDLGLAQRLRQRKPKTCGVDSATISWRSTRDPRPTSWTLTGRSLY